MIGPEHDPKLLNPRARSDKDSALSCVQADLKRMLLDICPVGARSSVVVREAQVQTPAGTITLASVCWIQEPAMAVTLDVSS